MTLFPDWREFIELLNFHNVEYVIVGAWARALHGVPRSTGAILCGVERSGIRPTRSGSVLKRGSRRPDER